MGGGGSVFGGLGGALKKVVKETSGVVEDVADSTGASTVVEQVAEVGNGAVKAVDSGIKAASEGAEKVIKEGTAAVAAATPDQEQIMHALTPDFSSWQNFLLHPFDPFNLGVIDTAQREWDNMTKPPDEEIIDPADIMGDTPTDALDFASFQIGGDDNKLKKRRGAGAFNHARTAGLNVTK